MKSWGLGKAQAILVFPLPGGSTNPVAIAQPMAARRAAPEEFDTARYIKGSRIRLWNMFFAETGSENQNRFRCFRRDQNGRIQSGVKEVQLLRYHEMPVLAQKWRTSGNAKTCTGDLLLISRAPAANWFSEK